jgi:hypothetical protein
MATKELFDKKSMIAAKKFGVDFRKAKNGKTWEFECREVFDQE